MLDDTPTNDNELHQVICNTSTFSEKCDQLQNCDVIFCS